MAVVIAAPTQVPPPFTPPTQVAAWEEPDPAELLALVGEGELQPREELARAERIADEAYADVIADGE
jgi:hypothetical protein